MSDITERLAAIEAECEQERHRGNASRGAERLLAVVKGVLALAGWHDTKADKARRFPGPDPIEVRRMEKAANVHDDAARRIRTVIEEGLGR